MIKLTAVALLALAGSPLAMPMTPAAAQPNIPRCDMVAGFRATCVDGDGTVYVMPQIPDEDLRREALMLAYRMNRDSMVLFGDMVDLTAPVEVRTIRIKPIDNVKVPTAKAK